MSDEWDFFPEDDEKAGPWVWLWLAMLGSLFMIAMVFGILALGMVTWLAR